MKNSNIAWVHNTWNPWVGCSAEHCEVAHQCYAKALVTRTGGTFSSLRQTSSSIWSAPYRWNAEAKAQGKCVRVFSLSMGDFFDRQADALRVPAWQVIRECQNLVFMILTKVPARIQGHLPDDWGNGYKNVWLGTSITSNKPRILERLDKLRDVPAELRFVSAEPLWGPLTGIDLRRFKLLIVGGESGPNWEKHKMDLAWAKEAYDIAHAQDTKFFFKQISARRDEQGTDALGKLIPPGTPRLIRDIPDGPLPWLDMDKEGDRIAA